MRLLILLILIALTACSSKENNTTRQFETKVLGTGVSDNSDWPYELLRLTNTDGGYTYAQWLPSGEDTAKGVLVIANPYFGIDWSGDEVDARWAARMNGGKYRDDEEPSYNSQTSSDIPYEKIIPTAVASDGYISLARNNKLNVLVVFGRFYAGGSLWNDTQDLVAGLNFIASRDDVDKTRVGLFGISWGGYEAIYGTAYAPDTIIPAATAVTAPATNFAKWTTYAANIGLLTTDPDYPVFFEPYLRRVAASSGGALNGAGADFSRFSISTLANRIVTPTLILHDEWDTLIPIRESCELVQTAGNIEGLWYQHINPAIDYNDPARKLNHGPLGTVVNSSVGSDYTWTMLYLLLKLDNQSLPQFLLYDTISMRSFFQDVYNQQAASIGVDWLLPRLVELTDDRVIMFDGTCTTNCLSGAEFLANELNAVWGTTLDSTTVVTQLADGLPLPSPAPVMPVTARCTS